MNKWLIVLTLFNLLLSENNIRTIQYVTCISENRHLMLNMHLNRLNRNVRPINCFE